MVKLLMFCRDCRPRPYFKTLSSSMFHWTQYGHEIAMEVNEIDCEACPNKADAEYRGMNLCQKCIEEEKLAQSRR